MTSCVVGCMRCLAAAVVLALATPAHAELWTSKLGDLLVSATQIEIVRVDKLTGTIIDGKIVEATRGASSGDAAHFDLANLAAPAIGDRVLVVCDKYECPRAAAIDRGGWFQLAAHEPGDGAFVTPSIVEHDSLLPLAMGRPAADLCITGTIELLDDHVSPPFTAIITATDGCGSGVVDKRRVASSLSVPWYGDERGIEVRLDANHHTLELVADRVTRGLDACYTGTFVPTRPFVRTRRSLTRALSGKHAATAIAQATFDVPPGAPVPSGRHVLELSIDDNGQLVVASDLANARIDEVDHRNGHLTVGFGVDTSDFYPQLELDLGPTLATAPDSGAAAALALAHLKTAPVTWITHPRDALVTTLLGTSTITYIRER